MILPFFEKSAKQIFDESRTARPRLLQAMRRAIFALIEAAQKSVGAGLPASRRHRRLDGPRRSNVIRFRLWLRLGLWLRRH